MERQDAVTYLFAGQDDAVVLLLEPLHGLLLLDLVVDAHLAALVLLVRHAEARPGHHDVEVHAVDTDARVVLDTQVDVLLDAEAEVARVAEVVLAQLVLLDLKALLQDLLGLGPRTVQWQAIFSLRLMPKLR